MLQSEPIRGWANRVVPGPTIGLHVAADGASVVRGRVPPNKGMKLTNLSEAPGKLEAPLRAFRRFAAVRTGSQLIPGVRRLVG